MAAAYQMLFIIHKNKITQKPEENQNKNIEIQDNITQKKIIRKFQIFLDKLINFNWSQ